MNESWISGQRLGIKMKLYWWDIVRTRYFET